MFTGWCRQEEEQPTGMCLLAGAGRRRSNLQACVYWLVQAGGGGATYRHVFTGWCRQEEEEEQPTGMCLLAGADRRSNLQACVYWLVQAGEMDMQAMAIRNLFLKYPSLLLSWMFEYDCLDTCCFGCLIIMHVLCIFVSALVHHN